MFHLTQKEIEELLDKVRTIYRRSGEVIAMLEHMIQLQSGERDSDYDPDDYLENELMKMENK